MEHLTVMQILDAMVKNNPNDMELGKAVRTFMIQIENAKKDSKEESNKTEKDA